MRVVCLVVVSFLLTVLCPCLFVPLADSTPLSAAAHDSHDHGHGHGVEYEGLVLTPPKPWQLYGAHFFCTKQQQPHTAR